MKLEFSLQIFEKYSNIKTSWKSIFVVPCIMLYSSEISPTRCNNCVFILRNGFTLHVSGDNLTHHQVCKCVTFAMTNKLVVIKSSTVPKIKKILLFEMKFLVPNYSCLQNPWLGGYRPQIPVLYVLNWICWTPSPEQNSWVRHWPHHASLWCGDSWYHRYTTGVMS